LPFKCNLQRYATGDGADVPRMGVQKQSAPAVGLCTLESS
jgi:hypothetical protein